jgi:glycosyltransferase involved in cell wall biosynthesis
VGQYAFSVVKVRSPADIEMRISFIAPPVSLGGGTKVIVVYAQQLMRRGHTVCIISPPPKGLSFAQKLKLWAKGQGWPGDPQARESHLDGSGVDHHLLDRCRPVTDNDVPDADVVIATWWETAEWVNALSPSKGAKVYFIQHHEVFPHLPVERCHASYRLPLHKIVIARWLKEAMRSLYGDDIVDVVPNSVERTQFFAPPRGKQAVPTVGVLYSADPTKGLDISLGALGTLRQCFPDLHVIAFGSGPLRADFLLPEEAEFFFCPPQDEIRGLYARMDVWVTASRSEGFNLPALEAMACRTPVVATRTGWPEEAVKTGRNGVLVDIEDSDALAKGVEWVLSRSDDEWRRLSSEAYATAASGSWEASADMFEKALHHACRRAACGEIGGGFAVGENKGQSRSSI